MEYRVLARKYRPATFADLVGQETLVRTLSNAITTGRIAHAFLLTGIRRIGKTTTARIIARALNCIGPDGKGEATINPCGICSNCTMIAADRHPDVVEMDAASHTGVGDIRDLIETVRYLPTSARHKIYIIDEVHMLSTSAFNALLKTLEEPPPHVKFIFATTESRKIPVTILSRCQRFDLRRLDTQSLAAHLERIAGEENIVIEKEALTLLSIAAEGSVRDGLSLLDRAIAHHTGSSNAISAAEIRTLLGLADRSQTLQLLRDILSGDVGAALSAFRKSYEQGADPALIIQDALDFTHFITRIKLVPEATQDQAFSEHERVEAGRMATALSLPALARLWQMLLKGLTEIRQAPSALAAGEMILARIAYAAELPTPAEAIQAARRTAPASSAATPATNSATSLPPAPLLTISDFAQVITLFEQKKEALLASQLRQFASLIAFEQGRIELHMKGGMIARDFPSRIGQLLSEWTGSNWKIILSDTPGAKTVEEQHADKRAHEHRQAAEHPLVSSVMEHFPGAELVDVRVSEEV